MLYAYKVLTISRLNGKLPKDELKINHRSYLNLSNSVESQPQNPEIRNNPENFYPCNKLISTIILAGQEYKQEGQDGPGSLT